MQFKHITDEIELIRILLRLVEIKDNKGLDGYSQLAEFIYISKQIEAFLEKEKINKRSIG